MKKIISFEKDLDFPSMIGEITSISLDNSLSFVDKSNIEGNFIISGTYKMTEASTLEEKFKYEIPVEIALTETFDLNDVKVSIDDFNYQIVNDDTLQCNIDVLVDGIEEVILEEEKKEISEIEEIEEKVEVVDKREEEKLDEIINEIKQPEKLEEIPEEELVRECDGDHKNKKESENKIQQMMEEKEESTEIVIKEEEMEEEQKNISSLFESLSTADETFTTYSIYIYRKEDTIEKILERYNTTKEALSDYNDLSSIEIGSKIIIPNTINE